jgi:hypothetical protein
LPASLCTDVILVGFDATSKLSAETTFVNTGCCLPSLESRNWRNAAGARAMYAGDSFCIATSRRTTSAASFSAAPLELGP